VPRRSTTEGKPKRGSAYGQDFFSEGASNHVTRAQFLSIGKTWGYALINACATILCSACVAALNRHLRR